MHFNESSSVKHSRSGSLDGMAFSRSHLEEFLQTGAAHRSGVYVLFGHHRTACIGHADYLGKRLRQHEAKKQFWQRAVAAFPHEERGLTPQQMEALEWLAIEAARKAGHYELENEQAGKEPHPSVGMEPVRRYFESLRDLLEGLGHPIF